MKVDGRGPDPAGYNKDCRLLWMTDTGSFKEGKLYDQRIRYTARFNLQTKMN